MAKNEQIQQLLGRQDCETILKRSLGIPCQFLSYNITKYREDVVGFLADHLLLTIKFIDGSKTYFVKAVPQFNTNQLKYVKDAGIFTKEVIVYKNLLTELLKINAFGPRCFFIADNCIVLEDLNAKGFKMLNKYGDFDDKHCRGLLKTLAGFHASTLIYEEKLGTTLDHQFSEEIKEACFSFIEGQPRYKWCVSTTACVSNLIKLITVQHEGISEKLHSFVFNELPKLISPSKRFKNVLTHDDLWCNNMLFNDQCECIFVDFQLVRYTPPGFDFLVTLLMNIDYKHLEEKLHDFIDIYYSHLLAQLKKHNISDKVLTKQEFEESVEYYRLAALTEAAMYGTHVYISEELSTHIIADFNNYNEFSFNRSKFAVKEFHTNVHYHNKLSAILVPLIKLLNLNNEQCNK